MKMRRNTVRPPLAAKPHLDDAPLAPLRQPIGAAMGADGAVDHGRLAARAVPVGLLLGGGRRTLEPLSSPSQAPTVINNRRRQPQSAAWGQPSISVGHEDLSVIGVCVVTTPIPEVLTYIPLATPFTTCLRATPSPRLNS
jgi:hypothetical protein